MPVLLLLLGCAPEPLDPDVWPSDGCASDHAPAWDSVNDLKSERIRLETPDGLELAAGLDRPKGDGCWPGLLFVPPGFESGLDEWGDEHTLAFARAGLVVMTLDVRGRGESEGEEAWAGPEQQDDVAGALRALGVLDLDPDHPRGAATLDFGANAAAELRRRNMRAWAFA